MGGKLFNFDRMPRAEYERVEARVRAYLDREFPGAYRIPRYYAAKADFGDMDVILAIPDAPPGAAREVYLRIASDLGIERHISTGHVFSTAFDGLQVDFFRAAPRLLNCTANYLAFNDLGNLVGRIFRHTFNLKYGMEGLSYLYRWADGHRVDALELSTDTRRMFGLVGLDHEAWARGFVTLDEMFAWTVASPYFSAAPYLDPESPLRRRATVRTTVARFVEYLEREGIDRVVPRPADRDANLSRVAGWFPEADLPARVAGARERERRAGAVKAAFNGRVVMEAIPGLAGGALGRFIKDFRASVPDFDAYAAGADAAEIRARLVAFHATWDAKQGA